jgi:hypothetical protein
MQPQPDIDVDIFLVEEDGDSRPGAPRPPQRFRARVLLVLWPAFMVAALLEALVFVVVDPTSLHGLGSALLAWPVIAVYSLSFLLFWALIAMAAAVTLWLDTPGPWQAT